VKRYGKHGRKVTLILKWFVVWLECYYEVTHCRLVNFLPGTVLVSVDFNLLFFSIFQIISQFNLSFFHIVHIFSLFNLLFFCIFHIFSLFNLLFFRIFHIISPFKLWHTATNYANLCNMTEPKVSVNDFN
jgi:hypothetical protein